MVQWFKIVHQEKSISDLLFCSSDVICDDNEYIENNGMKQLTTSTKIISDYKWYCHEICLNIVFDESTEQISGPGKHLEIYKSKFGKRKYNRGHFIEGQWVLGGICHDRVFYSTSPKLWQRYFATNHKRKNKARYNHFDRLL